MSNVSIFELRKRRDAPFFFKYGVAEENAIGTAIALSQVGNCTSQDEEFERVFQLGYTLGMVLSFPVGLMLDLIGSAQTRLVSQVVFTGAWVAMSFYKVQEYLVYCWVLLAFSGFALLMSNYSTLAQLEPKYAATLITIMCGVFDASKSMGYVFIKLNEIYALKTIFIGMAVLSVLMSLKTLTLHPFVEVPNANDGICAYKYSFVGRLMKNRAANQGLETTGSTLPRVEDHKFESLSKSVLSLDFIFSVIWYMIMCIRISSFFGWFDAWLVQMHFESDLYQKMIAFNSMFFYFSILFAALPGLVIDVSTKIVKNENGRFIGVAISMSLASLTAALFSALSAKQHFAANSAAILFAVFARTFVYGSYAVFVETVFPRKHFGRLLGLASVLSGLITLVNNSLFTWILAGSGLNGDFGPVEIGLAVASIISLVHPLQMIGRSCTNSIKYTSIEDQE